MNIREELFAKQDKEYKAFHERIVPNVDADRIIGVRIPYLREIAKACAKEKADNALYYYEEIMIEGMRIGYAKNCIEGYLSELESFVPLIDNWAVCDSCCSTYKFAKKYQKEVWEFICPYIESDREYEVRFAVVMMLDYFNNDEYIDRVIEILTGIKSEKYYINMAVAWALSVAYIKFPEKVLPIIKEGKLDAWVHNKTIQKICESYRVSKEDKEKLKKLKAVI